MKKKFVVIGILAIFLILNLSYVIYASTIEKTTITCNDENMYNALKSALKNYIMFGDADENNLTIKIPTDNISQITEIDLSKSQIQDITGIEKLTYLTKINLEGNRISNILPINNLNEITTLNLNYNNGLGNSLSNVLNTKTKLKKLEISNIGINDISFISNLTKLEELDISYGSFSSLDAIDYLHLKKLNIAENQSITNISSILRQANSLEVLNISGTGISKLELDEERKIGIYNLRNLKELYISKLRHVETLDPVIKSYFEEVTKVIEGEEVTLEEEKAYLNQIEILDISYTNSDGNTSIPTFDRLALLEKLKVLYDGGNNLNDVSEMYKLEELREVHLEFNKINDISGMVEVEEETNEQGYTSEIVKNATKATSIDLKNNEISEITAIKKMQSINHNITYLDLSNNHIYNTGSIETISGTVKLYDQIIDMPIYKKISNTDQYIVLLPIMQGAKNPSSKLYAENAIFSTQGCQVNDDQEYQQINNYNVIINNGKTEEDTIKITLSGGIADGSTINFIISEDSNAIDSILFRDLNLSRSIYNELEKNESYTYKLQRKLIININHYIISDIEAFDLSNNNISDLNGLENFDNLKDLNISKNTGIESIESLKYCTLIENLNASETSIGDNISAIEYMLGLKILRLNSIGLTKIDCINNLIRKEKEESEETSITDLDLSANALTNITGIEQINSLESLSVTRNNLNNIPNINSLDKLERLTMYSNKITKIPKLSNSGSLKYIYLSDNKIDNISELKNINTLTELDLNNNLIDNDDIQELQNVRVTNKLIIGGNNISDITSLRNIISNVKILDVSRNMIKDVSIIDSRFSNNGTLDANNQRIGIVLEQTDQDSVTIQLPQIFTAAKTNGSYFYTTDDFETNEYCTVSGNNLTINNLNSLGNNIATVKIINGKANGTTLSVAAPIKAVVSYSPDNWTKENVTATISFENRNDVRIQNNNGAKNYVFQQNGSFTFEYIDEYGMDGTTTAEVTWIDKEAPVITGVVNDNIYTSAVTPTITDNHEIASIVLTKDGQTVEGYTSGTEISEIGLYVLTATDSVGNQTVISFKIQEPPEPDDISSEDYTVDLENKLIFDIDLNTSVEEFVDKITTVSPNYQIKDKDGQNIPEGGKIGTGCTITTDTETYTLVVKCDLNGTGDIELNDLAQAQKMYVGILETDNLKVLAADLNNNSGIDLNDLAKLQKVYLEN